MLIFTKTDNTAIYMSHLQSLLLDDKIPSMWLDPVLYNKLGNDFKNELNIFVCYVRAHNIQGQRNKLFFT